MSRQHVFGLGEYIFNKGRGNDAQRNFAVDSAEGQVVDLIAERRNVGTLAGIDIHHQHVLAVEIDVRREVERERRVSALVFAQARAVDPHGRSGHGAFEIHEHTLAAGFGRKLETAAVAGDELVSLFVEAVPGQARRWCEESRRARIRSRRNRVRERPPHRCGCSASSDSWEGRAGRWRRWIRRLGAGECGAGDGRARNERAGSLEKLTSVHSFPREEPLEMDGGLHYLTSGLFL